MVRMRTCIDVKGEWKAFQLGDRSQRRSLLESGEGGAKTAGKNQRFVKGFPKMAVEVLRK